MRRRGECRRIRERGGGGGGRARAGSASVGRVKWEDAEETQVGDV